jgi:hypothetical protein
MSVRCIYNCGRETNNTDGICAGCAIAIHIEGYPRHMTKEEFDNFNTDCRGESCVRPKEEEMPFKKCPE